MFGVDWWGVSTHPLVVALTVAVVGTAIAFGRRVLRTLRALDEHVLPHFRRPDDHPPDQPDPTIPGRMAVVETEVRGLRADLTSLDGDLRVHMAEEARCRAEDNRQFAASIARVHDRIDRKRWWR